MLQIGAHVSISNGSRAAVKKQAALGGNVGQIFVGSPRGWKVSEFNEEDGEDFESASAAEDMGPWIVHGTYLINFATPKEDLADNSVNTVQAELEACDILGIPYYVFHPGSHTGAGIDTGIENISQRLSKLSVPDSTMVLLENTSGKGTSLGKSFDQLNRMATKSDLSLGEDIGYCIDTCHLYAAGYDFTDQQSLEDVVSTLDDEVGFEYVEYIHLNDSKHPLGSEKDEHAHISEGEIGKEGFKLFINHDRLRNLPMVLETPEEGGKGYKWNIEKVKELRE